MAAIYISDRTVVGKSNRIRLEVASFTAKVVQLKYNVSSHINQENDKFDLVYCGQLLKDDSCLDVCGIKPGSTVHALVRHQVKPSGDTGMSPVSNIEVKQVQGVLQSALINPAYRTTVEGLVNSPEALQKITDSIPGMDTDITALGLFQDPELLTILVHPGNIRRVMEAHPSFAQMAQVIAAAVKEAGSKTDFVRSTTGTYSLDQMSDDEDMAPGPSGGARQNITANQLAAALAAATGSPVPAGANTDSPGGAQMISPDFFQQAIMQATNAAMQSQVEQMREMGITDENVARQALRATNGDLQAALDLIFGGGL